MEKKIYKIMETIGAVFIVAAMLVIVANVLSRWVLGHPMRGVYEMTGLCAALFSAMAIPMATLTEGHIAVELVTSRLPVKLRIVLDYIARVCEMAVAGVLSYCCFKMAITMMGTNETTDTMNIPIWPVRFIWAFCLFLMVIYSIMNIAKVKKKYANGGPMSAADLEMKEALETAGSSMDLDVSELVKEEGQKHE